MRATLLSFQADLPGTSNDHPEFDYQFAAVKLRLANLGSGRYSGVPERQLSVVSTEAQTSRPAQLSEGTCAGRFAHELTLPPGASAEGCVPLQILVVSTPATLRFEPFRGSAAAALWSLQKRKR